MDVDAIVIGGGVAGLQAALTLGRSCRTVLVIDAGQPRNRFAAHSHNLLTRDGTPPEQLLALAREDLAPYDVRFAADRVVAAAAIDGGFAVDGASGARWTTRGLVVATGQVDPLPDVPGFREAWGEGVFACPYCHGWEHRGQPLGVWGQAAYATHMVGLIRAWTDEVHLLAGGPLSWEQRPDAVVHEQPVVALEVEGRQVRGARFADGSRLALGGLLYGPPSAPATALLASLGAAIGPNGLPTVDLMQATSVPRVHVAGDLGLPFASLAAAIATGAMAGAGLNASLQHR